MKKQKNKVTSVDKYGKYSEIGEMYSSKWKSLDLFIPSNFRMLCAILNVRLEDVLRDFMWMVSYSCSDRATEKKRRAARKFFLACGFGQPEYAKNDIKRMFNELKAVWTVCDTINGMASDDTSLFWKNNHMYVEYWFKRWFEKNKRTDDVTVLEKY